MTSKLNKNTQNRNHLASKIELSADVVSFAQMCELLDISQATARNWIRLGKMEPGMREGRNLYFNRGAVTRLRDDIAAGRIDALKKRRNKVFVGGNKIYKDYIPKSMESLKPASEIVEYMSAQYPECSEQMIETLIFDAASILLEGHVKDCRAFLESLRDDCKLTGQATDSESMMNYRSDEHIKDLLDHLFAQRNCDILGFIYISLKLLGKRKKSGSYYTPWNVTKRLVNGLEEQISSAKRILDPCCGTGNFILALDDTTPLTKVYGCDIDGISIFITRVNAALKWHVYDAAKLVRHFVVRDYLDQAPKTTGYDLIIGNPPWGSRPDKTRVKELVKLYETASSGSGFETYDLFVEQTIRKLKKGGTMSFVLPQAILNVGSHKQIRHMLNDQTKWEHVVHLGNVFHGVDCPSVIITVRKKNRCQQQEAYEVLVEEKKRTYTIDAVGYINDDYIPFISTDEENKILCQMRNVKECVYLENHAEFALGVVTGSNQDTLRSRTAASRGSKSKGLNQNTEGQESAVEKHPSMYEPCIRGTEVTKYQIALQAQEILFDRTKLQQSAEDKYYRAEKLVYRFISQRPVFALDINSRITLNSCNILIPHIKGLDIRYIEAVLNSSMAEFYFRKSFNSVKVLRQHIERIPIPVPDDDAQQQIITMVKELEKPRLGIKKRTQLEKQIDEIIQKLYNSYDKQ